ncbi:hypothetical protein GCM10010145_26620 [Streptomyces ruber]|uniref:STAS domain-containing protein n=2 Tax=Streptomyces TaxID=1883 RepID=A0A918ER69_9ACTN|nr:STAS domain-containing protein [Streptomyces ruber]GGQ55488.1 hypothetical protein GCM10010145_26620 [Streptomyces ruber]
MLVCVTGTLGVGIIDELREETRWLMTGAVGAPRRRLLVDLSSIARCTDESGLYVLLGMSRMLAGRGVELVLTSVSPVVEAQIQRACLQGYLRRGGCQGPHETT